jgi:hypothetical protein
MYREDLAAAQARIQALETEIKRLNSIIVKLNHQNMLMNGWEPSGPGGYSKNPDAPSNPGYIIADQLAKLAEVIRDQLNIKVSDEEID